MLYSTVFFIAVVSCMTSVYGIRFLRISFSFQATCGWAVVFKFEPNSAKHFVAQIIFSPLSRSQIQ